MKPKGVSTQMKALNNILVLSNGGVRIVAEQS